jgi:hypothetical protein
MIADEDKEIALIEVLSYWVGELLAAHCLLPTTHCLLTQLAGCLLRVGELLAAHCLLPTTHCLLILPRQQIQRSQ